MSVEHNESAGLQVLGVGLPRTGTASMQAALEILGYRCYHMFEVFKDAEQSKEWQRIFSEAKAGNETPGFSKVFHGYSATVDTPGEAVWPLILKEYPNAKVLLTKRPGSDWKKSVDNTIMRIVKDPIYPILVYWIPKVYEQYRLSKYFILPVWIQKYGNVDAEMINKRVREVKASGLPADQILDYELGSGWESLCKFLDRPIPTVDFPRINDREAFGQFLGREIKKGLQRWAAVVGAGAVAVGMAVKFFR